MTDDMRSRVLGMILGSVSRGQFPQREPVAFLYGHVAKEGETPTHTINGVEYVGVVAPDIYKVYTPELQAAYPNAAIFHVKLTGKYIFRCLAADANYEMPSLVASSGISCTTTGDEWSNFTENTSDAYIPIAVSIQPLVWTNFDAEYDGITYMTASDPIPIYE